MANLHDLYYKSFVVEITPAFALAVRRMVINFEVRTHHPEALHTPYLGIHKAKFLASDRSALFNLTGIDERQFLYESKKSPEIYEEDRAERRVISDAYNLLIVWLAHLTIVSNLPLKTKNTLITDLFLLMIYKFFTSIVGNSYAHGADPEVMALVIEQMNAKFDIKKTETGTWAAIIRQLAEEMTAPDSIHNRALTTFSPDKKVVYIISNRQTSIRNRIVKINTLYYSTKRTGDKLGDRSLIASVEGEEIIKSIEAVYDQMISGVVASATQLDRLIRSDDIRLVCRITALKQESMFRTALSAFSDLAQRQAERKEYDMIVPIRGGMTKIVGYRLLLTKIIQSTFSALAREKGVNIKNRADILQRTINLYRSSRKVDDAVDVIKYSVDEMLQEFDITTRDATRSSLKITFILYIILLGLRNI